MRIHSFWIVHFYVLKHSTEHIMFKRDTHRKIKEIYTYRESEREWERKRAILTNWHSYLSVCNHKYARTIARVRDSNETGPDVTTEIKSVNKWICVCVYSFIYFFAAAVIVVVIFSILLHSSVIFYIKVVENFTNQKLIQAYCTSRCQCHRLSCLLQVKLIESVACLVISPHAFFFLFHHHIGKAIRMANIE